MTTLAQGLSIPHPEGARRVWWQSRDRQYARAGDERRVPSQAVALSSIERALGAMVTMDKDEPYGLKPEDAKRRLAEELARLCREERVSPIVIGGLAVNHHGYARFTADVDLLVSRAEAVRLLRRFKQEHGWRRHREGFKSIALDVGVDICVEGERTSPRSAEVFPDPGSLRSVPV